MARFGGMAFADDKEFFPNMQTLIGKYLHKARETPIIIYQTVTNLSFSPFFAGLMFLFLDDHLPLGKIAEHHSPFSQSVGDEMGSFMQTVLLLAPLFPSD